MSRRLRWIGRSSSRLWHTTRVFSLRMAHQLIGLWVRQWSWIDLQRADCVPDVREPIKWGHARNCPRALLDCIRTNAGDDGEDGAGFFDINTPQEFSSIIVIVHLSNSPCQFFDQLIGHHPTSPSNSI